MTAWISPRVWEHWCCYSSSSFGITTVKIFVTQYWIYHLMFSYLIIPYTLQSLGSVLLLLFFWLSCNCLLFLHWETLFLSAKSIWDPIIFLKVEQSCFPLVFCLVNKILFGYLQLPCSSSSCTSCDLADESCRWHYLFFLYSVYVSCRLRIYLAGLYL